MTRVIGVLNYKGGTGKTTTVVNLAVGLALRGERVLCLDLDPQGGLASYFGAQHACTLTDFLLERARPIDCIINVRDNLDIIASDSSLMEAEKTLWRMDDEEAARHLLRTKMEEIHNHFSNYTYVILDYSPSVSLLSENGLRYTKELIVPVAMDYMALVGTRQVIKALQDLNKNSSHQLQLSLIVPTLYFGRFRKDREIIKTLEHYFPGRVAKPIRSNVKLSEAPSHYQSIYEYAPRSVGAIDYANLVETVASNYKVFPNGTGQ